MSHIASLDAYERSAVYQPFYALSPAAKALHFKRREAKAEAELDEMGHSGKLLWPDHYEATSEEYHEARSSRKRIVDAYVGERGLRVHGRAA
jgi:hypothetical protein